MKQRREMNKDQEVKIIMEDDPFVSSFSQSELKIAAEFLTNWLPYLTKNLCKDCTQTLFNDISSLNPDFGGGFEHPLPPKQRQCNFDMSTSGNWEDSAMEGLCDTLSLGSCKNSAIGCSELDPDGVLNPDFGGGVEHPLAPKEIHCNYDTDALNNWEDTAVESLALVPVPDGAVSLGSWKDSAMGCSELDQDVGLETSVVAPASWADMVENESQEDDDILEEEEIVNTLLGDSGGDVEEKSDSTLTRVQREYLRFRMVKRKKDFVCFRRVNGRRVNIVDGLELYTEVFNAEEQKRIVEFIYGIEEQGRKGELRERTFSAPEKWMPGKGRVTIQFGCCYNYAVLKDGSPPGILQDKLVDPMPHIFKVMIRRLVGWQVLPPTCVPDSCIVNIYDEGDCIPPHIDHHDFLRPFCTVSFLSECSIVFGSTLRIVGPGDFSGDIAIPLPLGSVLVLKGNGADVAKHCVPKVPTKRISITFRKMDESKHPLGFVPEPDLQGLEALPYEVEVSKTVDLPQSPPLEIRKPVTREVDLENEKQFSDRSSRSEPRFIGSTIIVTNWEGILPHPGDAYESETKSMNPSSSSSQQSRQSYSIEVDPDRGRQGSGSDRSQASDMAPQDAAADTASIILSSLPHQVSRQSSTMKFDPGKEAWVSGGSSLSEPRNSSWNRVRASDLAFPADADYIESFNSSNIPPQSSRQSLPIKVDHERGRHVSGGGSRSEPQHSSWKSLRASDIALPDDVDDTESMSSSKVPTRKSRRSFTIKVDPEGGRRVSRGDSRSESQHSRATEQATFEDADDTDSTHRSNVPSQFSRQTLTVRVDPERGRQVSSVSSRLEPRYASWNRSGVSRGPRKRVSLGT